MNMQQTVRRIIGICGVLAAISLGVAAQAQDTLPLPEPRLIGSFEMIYPTDTLRPDQMFRWTDIGANTYTLKAKITRSGETRIFNYTASQVCSGNVCTGYLGYTDYEGFFAATRTGDTVTFKIVAVFGDGQKMVSTAETVQVVEVENVELLAPVNNSTVWGTQLFTWTRPTLDATFVFVMVSLKTGLQNKFAAASCSGQECSINVYVGDLKLGTKYRWFVKTTGPTGESVKSAKRIFVPSALPQAIR